MDGNDNMKRLRWSLESDNAVEIFSVAKFCNWFPVLDVLCEGCIGKGDRERNQACQNLRYEQPHEGRRLRVPVMDEIRHSRGECGSPSRGRDTGQVGAEQNFWADPADCDGEMPRYVA